MPLGKCTPGVVCCSLGTANVAGMAFKIRRSGLRRNNSYLRTFRNASPNEAIVNQRQIFLRGSKLRESLRVFVPVHKAFSRLPTCLHFVDRGLIRTKMNASPHNGREKQC